jgi:hypothetical protein
VNIRDVQEWLGGTNGVKRDVQEASMLPTELLKALTSEKWLGGTNGVKRSAEPDVQEWLGGTNGVKRSAEPDVQEWLGGTNGVGIKRDVQEVGIYPSIARRR